MAGEVADGEANGYHYGIRLTKTDAADGTPLAGAVYTVTRDRSQTVVGTPTTGTASKTPSAPAAATPAQHQTQSPLAATGVSSAWICSVAIVLAGVAASLLAVRRLHD